MLIDDMLDLPQKALCQGGNMVNLYADEIACVVRASNVAELAQQDTRPLDQMPCLRPPFRTIWIEWARLGGRCGCFWNQFSSEETQRIHGLVGCYLGAYSWARGSILRDEGHLWLWLHEDGTYRSAFTPEEERELLAATLVPKAKRNNIVVSPYQFGPVSEWASLIGVTAAEREEVDRAGWVFQDPLTPTGQEIQRISALTLCLMHCKNVTAIEQVPPEKLQKARQKRGKRPLFRYHVLNIEPMAKALRKEGGLGSGTGLVQALHQCRGHFKDYRQSGLFGKVKGIFWWDHHVRGDAKQGVVAKDYEVLP